MTPADRRPRRVLIPMGGRVVHNALRARLLHGLRQRVEGPLAVTYLLVSPASAGEPRRLRTERLRSQLVTDETLADSGVLAVRSDDVAQAILAPAANMDLVVLGLDRPDPRRRVFDPLATRLNLSSGLCDCLLSGGPLPSIVLSVTTSAAERHPGFRLLVGARNAERRPCDGNEG